MRENILVAKANFDVMENPILMKILISSFSGYFGFAWKTNRRLRSHFCLNSST